MAHFMSLRLVAFAIAIEGCLPALRGSSTGEERQMRRIPVPGHEALKVVVVPGVRLHREYTLNFVAVLRVQENRKDQEDSEEQLAHEWSPRGNSVAWAKKF